MWATRQLTGTEWGEARAGLDAEQHRLETGEPASTGREARPHRDPGRWPVMTLDERRQVTRDYIKTVTVHRAKPGTKGFDRGRVAIEWR